MEIYSQTDNGTLYQGDCFEVLRWLPSDSMDTLITDPPYGLSFMGKKWDYDVPGIDVWKECLRVLKPGATALIFAGSRTQHRMAVNVEDAGFILKDTIMWIYGSGFPKSTDISKQLDKIAGKEREVIGYKKDISHVDRGDTNINDQQRDYTDSTFTVKNRSVLTAPATNEAKLWNGWGTALKPAYEPILVAMKPNDGTYAQNALKHGVAGLNIDGGRIESVDFEPKERKNASKLMEDRPWQERQKLEGVSIGVEGHTKGRFPANIIFDEEAGRLLDEQSGILKSGKRTGQPRKNKIFLGDKELKGGYCESSQGGASRFFYCAKASKAERNAGCEGLEDYQGSIHLDGGAWVKNSTSKDGQQKRLPLKNSHPTVKPLALMDYLVKLTATPTGGSVLDPFAGSGTTGIACLGSNRSYTLIEKETEYCEIIMARLEHAWFKNLC